MKMRSGKLKMKQRGFVKSSFVELGARLRASSRLPRGSFGKAIILANFWKTFKI